MQQPGILIRCVCSAWSSIPCKLMGPSNLPAALSMLPVRCRRPYLQTMHHPALLGQHRCMLNHQDAIMGLTHAVQATRQITGSPSNSTMTHTTASDAVSSLPASVQKPRRRQAPATPQSSEYVADLYCLTSRCSCQRGLSAPRTQRPAWSASASHSDDDSCCTYAGEKQPRHR